MDWADIYYRLRRNESDERAWDALVGNVRGWARPDLWDRGWAVVEDAVSDTAASVVLNLSKARGAETFAGFVRGHYQNVKRAVLQAALVPAQPLGDYDPPAPSMEPLDDARHEALAHCLDGLPVREGEAVQMKYFEEASAEQIGARLRVTRGNARRILHNGLTRLRRCLRQSLAQEGAA